MWEEEFPDESDLLRQGDMLSGLPFPRRGTLELTVDEMRAQVYPSRMAIVLDQCCTVEQRHTVLLGRVNEVRRLPEEHSLMKALRAEPVEDGPYSKYLHLLAPSGVLIDKTNKLWVVELLERVSIGEKNTEALQWLQKRRVARMTPVARAKLRMRLLYHFATVAEEDVEKLGDEGVDRLGRPIDPIGNPNSRGSFIATS